MHATLLVATLLLASVSMVHLHNTPPKHQEVIEVIEVQEVAKPVKHEHHHHHAKPVAVAVPVQQHVVTVEGLKQTVQRLWPLFCLIPKAYKIYKPLKIKCPKLLASATVSAANKVHAHLQQVQVQVEAPVKPVAVKVKA